MTGGSRGIGLAVAHALAAEGCPIILAARSERELGKASRELAPHRTRVLAMPADVSDPYSVDALFRTIRREFRRLDVVFNNAGIGHPNLPVHDLPYPTWREVLATNLDGLFLVTQAALAMLRPGGAIVNNLSIAARRVFPGSSAYNASKHGALGFTNTLREELRSKRIRVIALLPGATDTAIWKSLWPAAPRKKMMSSQTVAKAVVDALQAPPESTIEELVILPAAGTL